MGCFSEVLDQGKREKENKRTLSKGKNLEASKEGRKKSPASSSERPRMLGCTRLTLKVMYSNAPGLVVDGKELEIKDRIRENKPDIVRVVTMRLTGDKNWPNLSGGMRDDRERTRVEGKWPS